MKRQKRRRSDLPHDALLDGSSRRSLVAPAVVGAGGNAVMALVVGGGTAVVALVVGGGAAGASC